MNHLLTNQSLVMFGQLYLLKMLYEHSCMVGGCVAQNPFLFCPLYVFIHFSAAFCTVHCALDLARVHAPQKLLLLLITFLYSAILRSRADSLRSHVILHEWIVFIARFWISTKVVYLQHWHGWCHKNLLPERVSLGAFCVHHTTMHCVTSCKATYVRCMRV